MNPGIHDSVGEEDDWEELDRAKGEATGENR